MTEADLLAATIDLARLHGWRTIHVRPARTTQSWRTPVQGDGKGFPDLLMVRGDRLLAVELKSSVDARLRPEQVAWLDALRRAGAETAVWYPNHWPDEIQRVLVRRPASFPDFPA